MIAWFNGRFVDHASVCIAPDDRGFLFADGVYEVIRAYHGRPFALAAHEARLARSLSEVRIEWPDLPRLASIVWELLAQNDLADADALVYVQITRGAAPRRHRFPETGTPPTAYAVARPFAPSPDLAQGVAAILVPDTRWARCDIKSIALLPNVLAHQLAVEAGAAEAIFVRDGMLTEGTRANVAGVRRAAAFSHPLDQGVLPGVTSGAVREVCGELGIAWRDEAIAASDVHGLDELLLLGTTMEVTPVVRVDGLPVGDGRPGPIGARLLAGLRARTGH